MNDLNPGHLPTKTTMSENVGRSVEQSAKSLSVELFDFCQSDSLSEKGLREIIERRHGFTPNDELELIPNYNDERHRNSFHIACLERSHDQLTGALQF